MEAGEIDRLMLLLPPQHGKQIAHSTAVLTPAGWTTHGELRVGDHVFGSSGKPVRIEALSDTTLATVELEFTDGERIRCHENHEWRVFDRRTLAYKRLETRQLVEDLWIGARGRGGRARYGVDWVAIEGAEQALPCDPYALGAWLGDGRAAAADMCSSVLDEGVLDAVGTHYPITRKWTHRTTGVRYAYFGGGLRSILRRLNVLNNKHIPDLYFVASIEQRQRLLAGLMDTDGYIHHRSQRACFSTANERLAHDVATLVRTFGMRATLAEFAPVMSSSGIAGRKCVYQVTFSPTTVIPCVLERKATQGFKVLKRRRGIVAARSCVPEPGRCIQVESADGIYLVGRGLVPTHNSHIASRRYPAYSLGHDPRHDIISASATGTLAEEFGRDVRNLVASPDYWSLFSTRLAEDSQAAGRWKTKEGGSYYAVGIGGALMGRGATRLIIDDPFATMEDAQSEHQRERVWSWYLGTAYNRVRPNGAIILIQHRMHEDDLAGRLIERQKSGGDRWEIVLLPAIDSQGAALWPERYDIPSLERIRANTAPLHWSALYQQNPMPDEGTFFKREWFELYTERPTKLHTFTSADFAVTEDGGDYTDIATHGYSPEGDLYLALEGWCGQTSADKWIEALIDQFSRFKPFCFFGEGGPIRRAIEPFLTRRMRERKTYCRLEWLPTSADKATMARPLQAMASMGKVKIPDTEYGHRLLSQLLHFPAGKYDDAVDMASLMARAIDQAHPAIAATIDVTLQPKDSWARVFDEPEAREWRTA